MVLTLATGVGAAAAAGSPTTQDGNETDVNAEIGAGDALTVERGGVATIPVALNGTDAATVNVGYNDVNFNLTFEVVDGDGDDRVDARINTFQVGHANFSADVNETTRAAVTAAARNDSIRNASLVPAGDPGVPAALEPDLYDVNVTHDGRELAIGTLQILEPAEPAAESWTLPAGEFGSMETASDVRSAIDDGTMTRGDAVARGDAAVIRYNSSLLQGLLTTAAEWEDSEYATAFADLATEEPWTEAVRDGYHFEFLLVTQGLDPRQRVDVAETVDEDGLRVVPNFENGTTYLVLNTSDVEFTYDRATLREGTYEASLTAAFDSDEGAAGPAADTYDVVGREVSFDATNRTFTSAPDQTVAGTSTVAPGTTLGLRLDGSALDSRTTTTVVGPDGAFEAAFDLSDATVGGSVTVTATNATGESLTGAVQSADETDGANETDGTNESDGTTETDEPDSTDESDGTDDADDATATDGTGPGFSAGLAVLAVLGVALLGRRSA